MSRHWNPEPTRTRARPTRRGARVHAPAAATPWTQPKSYVPPVREPWPDGFKATLVIGAGLFVFVAAGFAQAL